MVDTSLLKGGESAKIFSPQSPLLKGRKGGRARRHPPLGRCRRGATPRTDDKTRRRRAGWQGEGSRPTDERRPNRPAHTTHPARPTQTPTHHATHPHAESRPRVHADGGAATWPGEPWAEPGRTAKPSPPPTGWVGETSPAWRTHPPHPRNPHPSRPPDEVRTESDPTPQP